MANYKVQFPAEVTSFETGFFTDESNIKDRDFLVTFTAIDSTGKQLAPTQLDAHFSKALDRPFRYLEVTKENPYTLFSATVNCQKPITSLLITIHPWKNKTKNQKTSKKLFELGFVNARTLESSFSWTTLLRSQDYDEN